MVTALASDVGGTLLLPRRPTIWISFLPGETATDIAVCVGTS
jgi:hypothetical protein